MGEHGQGEWIPYSPPGSRACNCVSCDPGYMVTDMYCVPEHPGSASVLGYEQHGNQKSRWGATTRCCVAQGLEATGLWALLAFVSMAKASGHHFLDLLPATACLVILATWSRTCIASLN